MLKKSHLLILALLLFLGAACGCASTPSSAALNPTITPASPSLTKTEPATTTGTHLQLVWKLQGSPNLFSKPTGVTVDRQGNVYVLDVGSVSVLKFDPNGKLILMWGKPGRGPGQFVYERVDPDAGRLAADSQGNIYVADIGNNRIEKFDSNGKYITQWGVEGTGDGRFSDIADIAIDSHNNVIVSDDINNTIQKFDNKGKFLKGWGGPGKENGRFHNLLSVAATPDDSIIASDFTSVLQKFDSEGNFLNSIPRKVVDNHVLTPWSLDADRQGNIYIVDHGNFRVIKLDPQGKLLATWNGKDAGIGAFKTLEDIALDEQGDIYLTDIGLNAVFKFRQFSQ